MRRSVIVAESEGSHRSLGNGLRSLVGEAGADFAIGRKSILEAEEGKSRETVLLGCSENLGMGKELGGGELEYAGPAQRSEKCN